MSHELEHVIASNTVQHLEGNNFFIWSQYGFRKCFSCDTQLVELTNDILMHMDNNLVIDCIFIDCSKALDRVQQCLLISKLSSLNLDSLTLFWVRNCLSFRNLTMHRH